MYNNPKHFLHEHLTFLESTGIDGKDKGFERYLESKGIQCTKNWDSVRSVIDWTLIQNRFRFFYDYEDGEKEIQNWLANCKLKEFEFLYTWFDYNDPIVKVKTSDFIVHWEEFLIGTEGLEFITENAELILEFTGSSNYDLWSNFEIKPESAVLGE